MTNAFNISMDLEPIKIIEGKHYFLIDSLYIRDLKESIENIDKDNLVATMKQCFPYSYIPFSYFKATGCFFLVKEFRGITEDSQNDLFHLVSDTGLLLIVEEEIIFKVIEKFDYDDLLDAGFDLLNLKYWQALIESFEEGQLGLMSPPGPDPNYGGGGVFRVTSAVMVHEI